MILELTARVEADAPGGPLPDCEDYSDKAEQAMREELAGLVVATTNRNRFKNFEIASRFEPSPVPELCRMSAASGKYHAPQSSADPGQREADTGGRRAKRS